LLKTVLLSFLIVIVQRPEHHQLLHVDFKVGILQMSLSKSVDLSEKPLGDLKLEGFVLTFDLADNDMKVNTQLRLIYCPVLICR